jgi:O-methyltransferase
MDTLVVEGYKNAVQTASDIHEHVPVLEKYARLCNSVCEFGVRSGVSTWGFARGLLQNVRNAAQSVSLRGYDLSPAPEVYKQLAETAEPKFEVSFHMGSDLDILPVQCDLLFIDTFHVYGQLKRELALHASGVRKYIIMHDTTVDEWDGELRRVGWNAAEYASKTGIPVDELLIGLWPAILEFLTAHPEWALEQRLVNNNGLTILRRKLDTISEALGQVPALVHSAGDLDATPPEAKYAFSYAPIAVPVVSAWKRIRTYDIGCVYGYACTGNSVLPCGRHAGNTWLVPELYIEYAARIVGGFVSPSERDSFVAGTYTAADVQRVVSRPISTPDEKGQTSGFENTLKLSMIGLMRLRGLGHHLLHVDQHGVIGDVLETGIWKGGACIFMALCLRDIGNPYGRKVIGCDSFAGLPPPNSVDFPADAGDPHHTYAWLSISQATVEANVEAFRLPSDAIVLVKGWFKDTLPVLRGQGLHLAVLRLDGDMYESTIQALTSLEPCLQTNGVLVIDDYDYALIGAKKATHDYRDAKGIVSTLIPYGDDIAVYWYK